MQVSYLAQYSALNMEVTCDSKTSLDFQRTARRYITENITLPLYASHGRNIWLDGGKPCFTQFGSNLYWLVKLLSWK
jgi:hypothetical protein